MKEKNLFCAFKTRETYLRVLCNRIALLFVPTFEKLVKFPKLISRLVNDLFFCVKKCVAVPEVSSVRGLWIFGYICSCNRPQCVFSWAQFCRLLERAPSIEELTIDFSVFLAETFGHSSVLAIFSL